MTAFRMPVEHGAWGILLVPFVCAAAVAARWNIPLLLCGVCVLAFFLLRGSLEGQAASAPSRGPDDSRLQRLFAPAHLLLGGLGGVAGGALVLLYRRYQILWLGLAALGLYLLQKKLIAFHHQQSTEKRSLPAELVGVALLTLTAPAAWIAARGSLFDPQPGVGWGSSAGPEVWLLNLFFFAGGILYVKYRVRGLLAHRSFHGMRERLAFAWPVFLYHFLLLAFLACWVVLDAVSHAHRGSALRSATLGLAFAPSILRAMRLLDHLGRRFPIRRLGWSETLHAAIFAILLIVAFNLSG